MFQPEQYLETSFSDLLSWTFAKASNYSNQQPVLIDAHDEAVRLSAHEVRAYVTRLVAGFRARGVGPGDCIWYSVLYLAAIGTGAHVASSNPAYKTRELVNILNLCKPKCILVEVSLLEDVLPATAECGIPRSEIFLLDLASPKLPEEFGSVASLLEHGNEPWESFSDEHRSKTTTAAILFTSGTTGLPKAACLSHFSIVSMNIARSYQSQTPYKVIRLLCLPQFHAFTAPLANIAPIRDGHTTYIMRRFSIKDYLHFIDKYQVTETTMVPSIVVTMLASPLFSLAALSSIRSVMCAGAPLARETQEALARKLNPSARIYQNYGMSEAGWITTFSYPEADDSGSVGRLLPNVECKIIASNGEEITEDCTNGRLLVRTPALMTGYLGDPAATQSTIVNGWMDTGDVGFCRLGKWYIVDRAKDLIKVRGWQVSPAEVESCLLTHPLVLDAAVIGVYVSAWATEAPRAYVVTTLPSNPGDLTEDELVSYVATRLSKFKSLSGGVRFVGSIPRNSSGKIMRHVLRDMARRDIALLQAKCLSQ